MTGDLHGMLCQRLESPTHSVFDFNAMPAGVNGIGDLLSSSTIGAIWIWSPTVAMGLVILVSLIGALIIATTNYHGEDRRRLGVCE